jgi:hypothetical protein
MTEDIDPINENLNFHGYQEWYYLGNLWVKGNYKDGQPIGYREAHGQKVYGSTSITDFFIR